MPSTPEIAKPGSGAPVLETQDLTVRFHADEGVVAAVNGLNLRVERGECFGVVGESGSGKSQAFMSIMGLLAQNGHATGSARLNGREILNAPRKALDTIRGSEMALIFQDPMSALTPFMRIGEQMRESLMQHQGASAQAARERVLEVLEMVRIPDAKRRIGQYPHELSGGMRQRVMIAQALLCKPSLLIADEPTTALDVTVQAEILNIFAGLKKHTDTAIVIITHDLGVIASVCDRAAVMYAGRVVEEGGVQDLFYRPAHPYTAGLLRSVPAIDADPDVDMPVIPGQPPNLARLGAGCAFRPRCGQSMTVCAETAPPLRPRAGPAHRSACHAETVL
ncbi:ABC transporter ATP-binding protein [Brevundimonas faecalis]|uniref:ABC transporter ATP-binding protein n=1 Tax=Brevundimonas faecalis TaxID=947378 RepID=UPI00361CBF92